MASWTRASMALVCAAWWGTCGFADALREPWVMHHISNEYLIANSLSPADLNGDGYTDYSVIDESLGSQTVLFHPGPGGDVRRPWRRVRIGVTGNPEYSCLGDGDLDMVANVEEHFRQVAGKDESFYSVVWFENPFR